MCAKQVECNEREILTQEKWSKMQMEKTFEYPGSLKHVKAIGWFIEEYNVAQISMNLTNYKETPIHVAFDEVCERARDRGTRVTGSELVGLMPLKAMLDAGNYFLEKTGSEQRHERIRNHSYRN